MIITTMFIALNYGFIQLHRHIYYFNLIQVKNVAVEKKKKNHKSKCVSAVIRIYSLTIKIMKMTLPYCRKFSDCYFRHILIFP